MTNLKFIVGFLLLLLSAYCFGSDIKDSSENHQNPTDHTEHSHNDSETHSHDNQTDHHHEEQHNKQELPPVVKTDIETTETTKEVIDESKPKGVQITELQEDNEESKIEVVADDKVSKKEATNRQFHPLYQPFFHQPSGFNMIRRQFGGGMDILGDIVMMGMIGLPILGLLTVGSSSIANFFGFGSSKPSSKRSKRSLKEKAAGAVEYIRNLWDVMEQLEKAFDKYRVYQAECRVLAVCEAHQKTSRLGAWGQTIVDLMRKQKEIEKEEILPVSRFIFSNYADAARIGSRGDNCQQIYTGCPSFLDDQDNEIN